AAGAQCSKRSGPPRHYGAYGPVERPDRPVRSASSQREGLAVPDSPEPQPPHHHACRAPRALERAPGVDPRRQAQAPHRVRVPSEGCGRRTSGPARAEDDGQGAAHSLAGRARMTWEVTMRTRAFLLIFGLSLVSLLLLDT